MNIAFFCSYNGSSAQAITQACLQGDIVASPVLMISNNPSAKALIWAENQGLRTYVINAQKYPDPKELDRAIADTLLQHKITLACCSGYMKLIGPQTLDAVDGKVLNIHPALLPQYGGQGMYGSHVHQAVKKNQDSESGCTIHLVNQEYDKGRIIAQKRIAITPHDSAEDIENKVKSAEPDFYVDTLRKIINGNITL